MAITLLDMLKEADLLTKAQIDEALLNRVVYGGKIGTSLIELGFINEITLAKFLSRKLAVPYAAPELLFNIPEETTKIVPAGLARRYLAVPVKCENKRLHLAMADPANLKAVDEIGFITDHVIRPMITPEIRLLQALNQYYGLEISSRHQSIIEKIGGMQPPPEEEFIDEAKLEEAEVVAEEEWENRIEHYSFDDLSLALIEADNRNEIANAVMTYLGQIFDHSAIFIVRDGGVHGWKGNSHGLNIAEFDKLRFPLDQPSVLQTLVDQSSPYLGGITSNGVNAELIEALGGEQPTMVLLLPLYLSGKLVNILYVDGGEGSLDDHMSEMTRLAGKAELAFEILVRKDKILMT
ncbi:MAG: general secretion pathway protein GspE [Desulfuromonas sp.]|nr:MAG: general secretion pathway protein GspE [Desulfuromonas sp.]